MAKEKPNECETINKKNGDSIDIIDKLTELVFYLNIDEDCQMLLKPSKIDLQNEKQFQQRADQVFKHHHLHDQIIIEENIMNELQQSIDIITNDLDSEFNKKKLESNNIIVIYDYLMTLKMLNLKNSKNTKPLVDFIKLNKINLEEVTKIEKELKVVLDKISQEKSPNKSDIKAAHIATTARDRRSICVPNMSRRNNRDANFRVPPRIHVERSRQLASLTNESIIFDPQTNEILRMRLESDHTGMVDSFTNRPNIDQNTRYRYDSMSHDLMTNSVEDDLQFIESPNLDSSMNLYKDSEESNSGDVYLILQPYNNWMES